MDNVDNFVDKMWISVDEKNRLFRGSLKNIENTGESGELGWGIGYKRDGEGEERVEIRVICVVWFYDI